MALSTGLVLAGIAALTLALVAYCVVSNRKCEDEAAKARRERELKLLAHYYLLMEEHEPTLRLRIRQATYFDAYGRPLLDKAFKELNYFFDKILVREIAPQTEGEYELLKGVFDKWVRRLEVEDSSTVPEAGPNDGRAYERQVASLLTQAGCSVRFTAVTGDQGVDLVAEQGGRKIALQCKNYAKPVGNDAVQQVFAGASFYEADTAAVVAPNGFTVSALQLASSLGVWCVHHDELLTILARNAAVDHRAQATT